MKLTDQRGLTKIQQIIAIAGGVVAVVAVIFAVYWAVTGKSLLPSLLPAKYTLNDKCSYNDVDLCRWLNNPKQFTKFRSVSTYKQGSLSSVRTAVVDNQNYQISSSENGKESSNVIRIGTTSYTKDYKDSKWFKQTAIVDTSNLVQTLKVGFADTKPGKTYAKAGKEACGTSTCFKYNLTINGITGTLWFDDWDYRLRKIENSSGGQTFTVEYSYDHISVVVPKPTKDTAPVPSPIPTITPTPAAKS